MRKLVLSNRQRGEMQDYVARHAPMEACGLLAGKNDRVEEVIFVRNQAQSPERFVMDPLEQLKAFDWIETNGFNLLGIFHSHPTGPETPSRTDIAEAAYEVMYLIWSLNNDLWKLRGFWIENGQAFEASLLIEE